MVIEKVKRWVIVWQLAETGICVTKGNLQTSSSTKAVIYRNRKSPNKLFPISWFEKRSISCWLFKRFVNVHWHCLLLSASEWAKRCLSMPCQALPMICGYYSLTSFNTQPNDDAKPEIINGHIFIMMILLNSVKVFKSCPLSCLWVTMSYFPFTQNKILALAELSCEPPPVRSQMSALSALSEKCLIFL